MAMLLWPLGTSAWAQEAWQIELSWTAPTENVDGSTLTDLDRYRIYYGASSRSYDHGPIELDDETLTTYTFTPAQPGQIYLAMTAIDTDGNESAYSGEIIRTTTATPANLAAAVLPSSRSVQVGTTATAFSTIINTGSATALGCLIEPAEFFDGSFSYQETDLNTNQVVGNPNEPVDIAAGSSKAFVFTLTPNSAFSTNDVELTFRCDNSSHAPVFSGVNTLSMTASDSPVPDMIALVRTQSGDGIVDVPEGGANAFAVASINVGIAGNLTASADTGGAALPLTLSICETNALGECLSLPAPSVTKFVENGATPTYSVFVSASGQVPFDPAGNRVYVRFRDDGNVTRGSTSVAVRTTP